MRTVIIVILFAIISLQSAAADDDIKTLLAEIVATHIPSPENEARLFKLFDHSDLGVRNSAKQRLAALYWKTGRYDDAEEILKELSQAYESFPPQYKVESLLTWSTLEFRRNNYVAAEEYTRKALVVAQSSHQELLGNTYYLLGNALQYQRKRLEAKQSYELALTAFEKNGNKKGTLLVLNSLGLMFKNSGDLVLGTKYLLQAREAVEEVGSVSYRGAIYYNLGDIFLKSEEPNKAIEYFNKALKIDLELKDFASLASDYRSIASAYISLENYTKALENNDAAIQQLLKVDAPEELSQAYLQHSKIYSLLSNENYRLDYLLLAEQTARKSGSAYQIMSVKVERGKYELERGNDNNALKKLTDALQVAADLSLDQNLMDIHRLLANAYQSLGNYQQALFHLNQSVILDDQLNTEDRREKSERYKRDVNLLEEQLKVSELQKIEAQQAQILELQQTEKQRLYVLLIAGAFVFAALTFLLVQRRKLENLRANLLQQSLKQKQELFADVSHELRTPLSALKLQIQALQFDIVSDVQDSYDKLDRKVNEINSLISDIYQLAQADTNNLNLTYREEDVDSLFGIWRNDWQTVVEKNGFTWMYQVNLTSVRKKMDAERIKQVIDNLLSNSIAYTDKPGTILLTARQHQEQLIVSIEDSAPTVDNDKLQKIFSRLYRVESSRNRQTGGSGLGLAICESLINAHGGTINAEKSALGGLKIVFRF
ncbi:tetratricopeptide repeat protein [Paraferrimonas haliotis]|uniref:histidine kinase n=1 Tax=Paraferrimonas haliotis TaxID=2013866 RepID=A0AA37TN56_9GAMM|nr:tetratricopeptide repeat protein [Paraferrimonas haliotis]GLS84779.1 hypothetical protein GCM10007894_27560 [Paraferrimonas haliotis]